MHPRKQNYESDKHAKAENGYKKQQKKQLQLPLLFQFSMSIAQYNKIPIYNNTLYTYRHNIALNVAKTVYARLMPLTATYHRGGLIM